MVLEEKLVLSINKKTLFSRPLMFPGKKMKKTVFSKKIKKIADFLSPEQLQFWAQKIDK